jgi:hypothetical protein
MDEKQFAEFIQVFQKSMDLVVNKLVEIDGKIKLLQEHNEEMQRISDMVFKGENKDIKLN